MTASTPRITEQQARARFSDCNGLCNSGRLCTCREPADMGTTLGIEASMAEHREPMSNGEAVALAFIYSASAAAVFSALYMLV